MARPISQLLGLIFTTVLIYYVNSQPVLRPICPTGFPKLDPLQAFPFSPGCVVPGSVSPREDPQDDPSASNKSNLGNTELGPLVYFIPPDVQLCTEPKYHYWPILVCLVFLIIWMILAWFLLTSQDHLFLGFDRIADYCAPWARRRGRNTQQPPPTPTGPSANTIPPVDIPTDRHVVEEKEADLPRVPPKAHGRG